MGGLERRGGTHATVEGETMRQQGARTEKKAVCKPLLVTPTDGVTLPTKAVVARRGYVVVRG